MTTGLQTKDLGVRLGSKAILTDISIAFEPGSVTAIIGPNGCGKSTFLRSLMGFITPVRGQVTLDGTELRNVPARSRAQCMAYLPQSQEAPDGLRVQALVERGRTPYMRPFQPMRPDDRAAVTEALELTGMTDLAARRLDRLSGGQRQRAWIALTVAQKTPLLLLDEPTTYLDLPFQIEVLKLVRRLRETTGKTVIMVLHDINLASHYADRVLALKNGRVAFDGPPSEVVSETNLSALFGMPLRVSHGLGGALPLVLPA